MNDIERTHQASADGQAARNATMMLECPWCAEPLRVDGPQLFEGTVCPACRVEFLLDDSAGAGRAVARPLAA